MENNPKISIIIPVYNAEKQLDRCMRSVLSQTFTDWEAILVNDGSTDGSAAVCRRYAREDPRVSYIEKENGGAGSARNAGLDAAKGEYVAFPDADDTFESGMYEALYALAESGGFDMVFSGVKYYTRTDGGDAAFSRTQNIEAVRFCDCESCRAHIMTFFPTTTIFDVPWNKLYRRRIIEENRLRFTDIRRCQDALFNLDFFNCINSAAATDQAYYHYYENTVEDVRRKFPRDYMDIMVFYYTRLVSTLTAWGVYRDEIKRHYDTTIVLSVYSTACRYDNPRWDLSRAEQRAYILDCFSRSEITALLEHADVREDALEAYEIILARDVDRLIRLHNKERRKDALRQNKLLIGLYRKLKG